MSATGNLQEAREAQARERTKLLRLEYRRRRGELVDRAGVERAVFRRARLERDAWMAWATRTAPMLASELKIDEGTVFRALDRLVREQLEHLASVEMDMADGRDDAR